MRRSVDLSDDDDVERKIPPVSSPPVPIEKAVVDVGRRHAFYKNNDGNERFNLVAVHRMNLHFLRKRILDHAATIFNEGQMDDESSDKMSALMEKYCAAVKTREFMRDWALRDYATHPFIMKPEQGEMERELLRSIKEPPHNLVINPMVSGDESRHLPRLPGWPWDKLSANRTRRERYLLAVLGGLTLTLPMVFMVVMRSTAASLATVSVCTVVFSIALAYFFPHRLPTELLTATAAYAAVLAVFVGGTAPGT